MCDASCVTFSWFSARMLNPAKSARKTSSCEPEILHLCLHFNSLTKPSEYSINGRWPIPLAWRASEPKSEWMNASSRNIDDVIRWLLFMPIVTRSSTQSQHCVLNFLANRSDWSYQIDWLTVRPAAWAHPRWIACLNVHTDSTRHALLYAHVLTARTCCISNLILSSPVECVPTGMRKQSPVEKFNLAHLCTLHSKMPKSRKKNVITSNGCLLAFTSMASWKTISMANKCLISSWMHVI